MTEGLPEIHLGSGAFWFWPRPFWTSFDPAALARMGVGGLQVLCEPVHGAPPLPPADLVTAWRRDLDVTVHPTFYGDGFTFDAGQERAFADLRGWLDATGVRDVVIHANHFARGAADVAAVKGRLPEDARVLVENVGARAASGHSVADVRGLLEADGAAGAVLDIAHLAEVPAPLNDARAWLADPVIDTRLAMVHVSRSGIAQPSLRPPAPSAIAEADHLPAFLGDGDDRAVRAALARVPLVIEGCFPPGPEGHDWLAREIAYLSAWTH